MGNPFGSGSADVVVARSQKLKAAKAVNSARKNSKHGDGKGTKEAKKWAKKLNVSLSTIYKWSRGKQIKPRFGRTIGVKQKKTISRLHAQGKTTREIATKMGLTYAVVYHHREGKSWYETDQPLIQEGSIAWHFLNWRRPEGMKELLEEICASR